MYKEILHNIVKHSNAKKVTVLVDHQHDAFTLTVRDDGVGFDHTEDFPGNGMKSLKLRADEINGHLKIDSIKDVGTTVTIMLENYTKI
jgi:signal transduction histidine kinase